MPAVKKSRKAPKKKAKNKKAPSRRASDGTGVFAVLVEKMQQYTLASVAGAGVLIAGLVAVLWAGGYVGLLTEQVDQSMRNAAVSSGFAVREISLRGRRETTLEDVEGAVGPIIGQSLAHIDLDAARSRVEALGWVRAAAVSRLWPNRLMIAIKERAPAAVWQVAGELYLIDNEGAVIREVNAHEYSALPFVVGAGAPDAAAELLQALEKHPEIEELTAALVRVSERRWNLRLHSKVDVKLPETDIVDALEALSIIQGAHGTLDQKIEYVDLRDPERVIVRPRTE